MGDGACVVYGAAILVNVWTKLNVCAWINFLNVSNGLKFVATKSVVPTELEYACA